MITKATVTASFTRNGIQNTGVRLLVAINQSVGAPVSSAAKYLAKIVSETGVKCCQKIKLKLSVLGIAATSATNATAARAFNAIKV